MVTRMNAYVFAIALNSVGLFSAKPEKKKKTFVSKPATAATRPGKMKAEGKKTHTYSKSFIG